MIKRIKEKTLSVILAGLISLTPLPAKDFINKDNFFIEPSFKIFSENNEISIVFETNLEYKIETSIGNFTPSIEAKISSHSNFLQLDKNGIESCFSPAISYENNYNKITLGTNFWNGVGELKEFKQQTGILSITFKNLYNSKYDLRLSYENDGAPFQLIGFADFKDRYRTGTLEVEINNTETNQALSADLKIFTGNRLKELEKEEDLESITDKYGNFYPNGYVHEVGIPYRCSTLSITYKDGKNFKYTIEEQNDFYRHAFQDLLAHSFLDPIKQGGFKCIDNQITYRTNIESYRTNIESYNPYLETIHTLY